MTRVLAGWLVLTCTIPLTAADEQKPQKASKAAEEYARIQGDYDKAFREYRKALMAAKTPEGRKKVIAELSPAEKFVDRFFAIAEKHPDDPAALEALIWVVRNTRNADSASPRGKSLVILRNKYLESPKLGPVAFSLGFGTDKGSEELLRDLIAKNPSREIQGQSAMALGMYLRRKRDSLLHGGDKQAAEKLERQMEAVYDRVVKEWADVQLNRGAIGKLAEAELFEIRFLCPGKPAPDIQGLDAVGKSFKLSDYRGKVVLIDFWASWCEPCMKLVPHASTLSSKLASKPFAVVGVNLDRSAELQKACEEKNDISWRSFHDGSRGPICQHWNVHEIPTLYILDHKGIIRHKYVDSPGDKVLDENVEALLKEAQNSVSQK